MRNAIIACCLLGLAFLGIWATARYQLDDAMYHFEKDLQAIGPARGGHAPEASAVEDRIAKIAEEHELEVSEITVLVEPLTSVNMYRAGGLTSMVQGKLDDTTGAGRANLPTVRSESSAHTAEYMADQKMEIKGILIDIEVHAHAERWLWTEDEDYEMTITLR